jgi:predicted Zn-dependent protease
MRFTPSRWRVVWLALLLAVLWACVRNPVTQRLQFALITEAQEIEIGREGAAEVERSIGLVPDPALQKYMQALGVRMAKISERPDLPWRFGVVDDPTPNAFALPGGFIYFTRGMLGLMNTEAELASVLGHEIAHVTARHQVAMISRAQLAQVGLGLGGVLFPELEQLGGVAGVGLSLLFLRYGRDAERQADDLGFGYALEVRYDARQMASVFETLGRMGEAQQRSPVPGWLQTHPLPAERVETIRQRAAALDPLPPDLRTGRAEYLTRIDGLVYGVNPRHGFFRDGAFLHPDLRFRFSVPAKWRTQNLAQAVMAVSPEQNAALQLTIARDQTPDAAARRFGQQQGVQLAQTTRQTINGLPAVVTAFRAQTPETVVQGIAGFISHEKRVYQLLGYTPSGVFARYQGDLQRAIGSFAPLTDPAVLAVQPNRLRIVTLKENMTVAEFHKRFPSQVDPGELALINGVASPASVLPAGSQVKRVAAQ